MSLLHLDIRSQPECQNNMASAGMSKLHDVIQYLICGLSLNVKMFNVHF